MSLTLVQLAEAIQNDRAIEIKGGALGDVWTGADLSPICLNEIRTWLKFGHVRIKPEAREFWLLEGSDIRYSDLDFAINSRERCVDKNRLIYRCQQVLEQC